RRCARREGRRPREPGVAAGRPADGRGAGDRSDRAARRRSVMQRTSWQVLVLLAIGGGLVAYLVLSGLDGRGYLPVPVPMGTALGPAALSGVLLWLGRNVRRLVRRDPTSMTPLGAARVVVLAKASALVGAVLVGYFGAQLVLA